MSSYLSSNTRPVPTVKQSKQALGMLTDLLPVVGDVKAASEMPELLKQGRYGAASVNALSMLPAVGFFGDVIKQGTKATEVLKKTNFYHGTTKDFDKFDLKATRANRGTNMEGIYLTPSKTRAAQFGDKISTHKVNLDMSKIAFPNTVPNSKMIKKYKEQLLNKTNYKEDWIDEALIPDFIETKRIKADLRGDIKREVYEAGGYKGFADGDDLVVFDPDFIK
tara:strand:- start:49 stop:714 length:666 start_codon:yes stop_codon:yes gene_type:complete